MMVINKDNNTGKRIV